MDRPTDPLVTGDLTNPLPGREREQEQLIALLHRSLHGDGSVVLISGEAGIGKTTLIERLAAHARQRSALVLSGQCYAPVTNQPFFPWRQLYRADRGESGSPRSPESIDSARSREELYELVAGDLRSTSLNQPVVVIIEDIHWADNASLELLRYVARQTPAQPMLLVVSFRSDEPGPMAGLKQLLPEIVRESRAERIDLRRLDLQDVEGFIESRSHSHSTMSAIGEIDSGSLSRYLFERSGGNPLFMTELLRDLGPDISPDRIQNQQVPSLVRQVIENRVDRLDESHRSLLATAAVIGQEIPIDLWQAVAGSDDDELAAVVESAVGNHLLTESGDGGSVRFVHGLIQETLYQSQVSLRRRRVHRQIAEWLADRPDPQAAVISHHFSRAGDRRAVDWFIRAAENALRYYAAQDAITSINRVEQFANHAGMEVPLDAYRLRARAKEMLGENEQARSDLTRLLELARRQGDRLAECQALIEFGMLWASQDYQQCGVYLHQALEIAETLEDELLRAQCLNRLANWQANIGEFDSAVTLHQQALRIFEALDDQDGVADTLDLIGTMCHLGGDYPNARDHLERAIAISRDQGNKWRLSSSLAVLCNVGGDMDSTFDASTVASRSTEYWIGAGEESIAIAREIGWISGESFGLSMLGATHCVRGNFGSSLKCAEAAEAIAHRINHQQWLVAASLLLGVVWGELLDESRAEYYLERTLSHARGMGSHLWTLVTVAALSNVRLQRGDASGRELLEPFLESECEGPAHGKRAFQFAWAKQLQAAGDSVTALATVDRLLSYNDSTAEFPGTPQILELKAGILLDMGRINEAIEMYQTADRVASYLGFRAMRWRVQWAMGRVYAGLGNRQESDRRLESARENAGEIARELPDHDIRRRFIREVERRLDGARQPAQSPASLGGLTPREIEVLRLVARGYSDANVAEELFISPRTVARHLQSIYTKLDVNSRTQAAHRAIERELIPRA